MPICPKCKKDIEEGKNFCPSCGASLTEAQKSKKKSKGCLSCFAVIGGLFFLICIFALLDDENEQNDIKEVNTAVEQTNDAKVNVPSTLTDSRDGKIYKVVKIGSQVWTAENMNVDFDKSEESSCYENFQTKCKKNGRLYTWMGATKACPDGWHLPTTAEYSELVSTIGGKNKANKLKSTKGWTSKGATDDYGFSALPGGQYNPRLKIYDGDAEQAFFWTASTNNSGYSSGVDIFEDHISIDSWGSSDPSYQRSVRCIMNDPSKEKHINSELLGTLTDSRDGKVYKTVKIADMNWMAENLNYEYQNGKNSWCFEGKKAMCQKYGRLYSAEAREKVCPEGWRVPDEGEYKLMVAELGEDGFGGGNKLKSKTVFEGKDVLGFAALLGGYYSVKDNRAYFEGEDYFGYFWTASPAALRLQYDNDYIVFEGVSPNERISAFSIRCVEE